MVLITAGLSIFWLSILSQVALVNAFIGVRGLAGGKWGARFRPEVLRSTEEQKTDQLQAIGNGGEKLTQKEYLIAVRNRLFAVEEQIWLHEYALARPQQDKILPFSQAKYDKLLRARGDLMDEYPVTRLYTDLRDAQQRNMTYAAM